MLKNPYFWNMLRSNTQRQIAGCFNVPAFWRKRWEFLKKLSEWCLGDYKILKSCKNRSTFKSLKRFNFIISLGTIATITWTTSCYFIGRRWDRNRITSFCSDVSSLRGGEWHLNQAYSHASELFCHTTLAIACSMTCIIRSMIRRHRFLYWEPAYLYWNTTTNFN